MSEKYYVGQGASVTKTISEGDVYLFAGITGDFNPVHINATFADSTIFGKRIVHGVLSAGLISSVLGMQLPGSGSILLSQTIKYTAPVYFGDTLTATAIVKQIFPEKNRITLTTLVVNQDGKEIIIGEASLQYT